MRPTPLVLSLALGCGAPTIPGAGAPPAAEDDDGGGGVDSGGGGGGGGALPAAPGPWLREERVSPGPITFNELHYHPADAATPEWLELHNPLVLDLDLSGWRLDGGVAWVFPRGTILPAGGFLVVSADPGALAEATGFGDALGPFEGSLSNRGERVDLFNNAGRRIDSVGYGGSAPWPVQPDGSGATLAKRGADLASDRAEHWVGSGVVGGTPGADNGLAPRTVPTRLTLVAEDAVWWVDTRGGAAPAGWAEPGFDDGAWEAVAAPVLAGVSDTVVDAGVRLTADNHFAAWVGPADGSDLRPVSDDADGSWTTPEDADAEIAPGDHLFVAAWELTGDSGSPQMLIGEVDLPDGVVGTNGTDWEWVLGAVGDNPGAALPDPVGVAARIADADADAAWALPGVDTAATAGPWGGTLGGAFSTGRYVWADTFDSNSVTNVDDTYVLFRSIDPLTGAGSSLEVDPIPVSTRLRTGFAFDGASGTISLRLGCTVDDGALVMLNGVEVLRENLPAGALGAETLAATPVDPASWVSEEIDAGALRIGENVLAVDLRQASPDDGDLALSCSLVARVLADPAGPTLVIDELPGAGGGWVELRNRGSADVELGDVVLVSSTGAAAPLDAGPLAPGARRLVEGLDLGTGLGDRLFLRSADGAVVLDAARIEAGPRARDAAGAWRVPSSPTPGEPNEIDLQADIVIHEIQYHRAPVSEAGVPFAEREEEWIELFNRGDEAVDLGGWSLSDGVAFTFPEGTSLAPGAFLVVARDAAAMRAAHPDITVLGDLRGRLGNGGDRLVLVDAVGNPADELRYADGGRWPTGADGGGSTLELRDPWADNAAAEAWAASDEAPRAAWTDVVLRGVAAPSAVGPDGQWEELVLGMLDAGVVLIDDLSVVQDPDTDPVELVQNGGFDDQAAGWRLRGTHRHGGVVPDPDDAGDPVLRLVATGPTGHMHNQVSTTLGAPIGARPYEISFRARWVSGSNQLHTRLYFNRLPHTTLLPQPATAGTPGARNSVQVDNLGPTHGDLSQDVAVPAPGEPVVVSVTVSDPDGVEAVTLWAAVDGGPFDGFPMAAAGADRYTATLPGQAAGALVQLFVESTDAVGASSTAPAAGPDSRALYRVDDGAASTTGLHDLRILMTPDDVAWLHDPPNLMSNDRVGATVIYGESEVFHDVGVRLKGSQRGRPTLPRVGYALRFADDQPFRGSHTSVMIDRSEGVGYGQREVLHNLVMTRAGSVSGEYNDLVHVMAPLEGATGSAELQLDRFSGLVLDAQFEDGAAGTRYEYELVYYPITTDDGTPTGAKLPQPDRVQGTPITDLGGDPEAYRWVFLIKNNERRDDYGPVMDLGALFASSDADLLARAPDVIDVDQWLRAFALSTLSGATDQYGGAGSQHNVQFYARPSDGRVLHFPHDLDFSSSSRMPVVGNADLARLLQDPDHERAYYAHLHDIMAQSYDAAYLAPWCAQLGALLPGQPFDSHCAFVADRAGWVRAGAGDAVEARFPPVGFAITTNGGDDLSVATDEVRLEGRGWIDVTTLTLNGSGAPLPFTWLDDTTWQAVVPLAMGDNDLEIEALDRHGERVGGDRIGVERTGG